MSDFLKMDSRSIQEPEFKAKAIKEHFRIQVSALTNEEQIKLARAYIGRLLEDIPIMEGDYTWGYKYEWWQYNSYWQAVLNAL
jgi:hypothetical protein